MAKVLLVTSSWRKNSNSSCLATYISQGAIEKEHEVTTIDIARVNISPCRGCGVCQTTKDGRCIQKDGMEPIYPLVEGADVLVLVSPVYWFNLCGQLKQFLDRCYPVAGKETPDGSPCFAKKKIGLVLVYGDTDPYTSGAINAIRSVQDICTYTGAAFAGALYGSAFEEGEITNNIKLLDEARTYGASL